MPMKNLSCGAELWLDLWIKISLKLSWVFLFKIIEHKQTNIVTIQDLSNIKHYSWFLGWNRWCWQLEHTNVYKFLGIGQYEFWAEIFTKFSLHLNQNCKKGKNKKNHTSWQKNQCPGKKVKGKCACCFGSKFIL